MLELFGIVSEQWGDQILTRRAIFQVIESCAGLVAIQTLFMSSIVYVELLHRSRLRAAALVLASPFIGVVVNRIRVFTIVLSPYSELAAVHTLQGLVMVRLGVLLIAAVDAVLHLRGEDPPRSLPTARTGCLRSAAGGSPVDSPGAFRLAGRRDQAGTELRR